MMLQSTRPASPKSGTQLARGKLTISERLRPDQEQAKRHKTRDYRYAYRGYHSEDGICRVRVFEQTGKVPIIIVTELPENTNTSITNMCEYLAYEIIRAHFPERFEEEEPVLWIEHYERDPAERDAVGVEYSLVEFESWTAATAVARWGKRLRIGQPSWKHVERDTIEQLVGSLDE